MTWFGCVAVDVYTCSSIVCSLTVFLLFKDNNSTDHTLWAKSILWLIWMGGMLTQSVCMCVWCKLDFYLLVLFFCTAVGQKKSLWRYVASGSISAEAPQKHRLWHLIFLSGSASYFHVLTTLPVKSLGTPAHKELHFSDFCYIRSNTTWLPRVSMRMPCVTHMSCPY